MSLKPDGTELMPVNLQVPPIPQEFAEDEELRLGRANGNIYVRIPGVPDGHDGQVMVRLKKKRVIVIDYSITPDKVANPLFMSPTGAGKAICTQGGCNKIGVPVLLYDSVPLEPPSLYLRSGLCFTCQRALNEKRRTQRKRKSDVSGDKASGGNAGTNSMGMSGGPHDGKKKYKVGGVEIDLPEDAIIVAGPPEGTKMYDSMEYNTKEISHDLQQYMQEASNDMNLLLSKTMEYPQVSIDGTIPPSHVSVEEVNHLYDKALETMKKPMYLLTQWKASWDAQNPSYLVPPPNAGPVAMGVGMGLDPEPDSSVLPPVEENKQPDATDVEIFSV